MKKVLLIICIVMMLSGCGAENLPHKVIDYTFSKPRIQKVLPTHVFEEVPDDDDSWKYDVAERLYNEFCYFYANIGDRMENDTYYREYKINWDYKGTGIPRFYTDYNALMAADRAKGVIAYRDYLDKSKVDYVLSKKDEINQHISWFEWVYSGYTKSGLHFVALAYNYTSNAYYCEPACNKIRGDVKESEFLTELHYCKNGPLGVDLYVEDLSQRRDEIEVYPVFMDSGESKNNKDIEVVHDYTPDVLEVLKQYGRQPMANDTTKLKNKSWNLYIYTVNKLADEIMIETKGSVLELVNDIP